MGGEQPCIYTALPANYVQSIWKIGLSYLLLEVCVGRCEVFEGVSRWETCGDMWRHVGTYGDICRHVKTFEDMWRYLETCGDCGLLRGVLLLLDTILHIACFTRPDIMFCVLVLSKAQNEPTDAAVTCLNHLLRYLAGTIELGLTFRADDSLDLVGWCDASWATKVNARSTSGLVFTVNQAPILWSSKQQTIIARSTCEAEYVAGDLAAREATWLQLFWHEILCWESRDSPSCT